MYVVNGKSSIVRFIAGLFILMSLILTVMVSQYWLIFTAFIGMNLMISSLTGFCILEKMLVSAGISERQVVRK